MRDTDREKKRERKNQSDLVINHSAEEKCFTKECYHVSVSFCFCVAKTLAPTGAALSHENPSPGRLCGSLDAASLTLSRTSLSELSFKWRCDTLGLCLHLRMQD